MSRSQRYLAAAIGLSSCAVLLLVACTDDDTTPGPTTTDSGVDATTADASPIKDGGANIDAPVTIPDGGTDSGPTTDAATDSGADAGPTSTEAINNTGYISVNEAFAYAELFADDTVARWSNSSECILVARSGAKSTTNAGKVTIGGNVVGKDGGLAAVVTLDETNQYQAPDTYFPATNEFTVDIEEGPTVTGFSALPIQTLPTSLATPIAIKTPVLAPPASFEIDSSKPFEVTWTAPAGPGDLTNQRVLVDLAIQPTDEDTGKLVKVFCAFPVTAGKGAIPSSVLVDIKKRAGGGATAGGSISFFAGGQKTVTVKSSTYVLEVARSDSTDNGGGPITIK